MELKLAISVFRAINALFRIIAFQISNPSLFSFNARIG
jgi:hypothetical protein